MNNNSSEAHATVIPLKDLSVSQSAKKQTLPVYSLAEILRFTTKIYTELGKGAHHSSELISRVHNVTYDGIKQKFSTAQEYGLLELKHRVGYKLTDLFLKIHKPENDNERKEGIIESLRKPSLYSQLIDEFNGHTLPTESGLAARLVRSFGIKEYSSNKVAAIFLNNLKDNNLVHGDTLRVAVSKMHTAEESQKLDTERNQVQERLKDDIPPPSTPSMDSGEFIEIPIPLGGNKRRAYLRIPEDYKPEDCERIAKFVDALK